jgi:ribosomal protein L29
MRQLTVAELTVKTNELKQKLANRATLDYL